MSNKKSKLTLTWIGKENRPKLEPRILLEDGERSHHAKHRVTHNDIFDNRLIFGDNLLALKSLEQEFAGKVKCVFIDPPYNTGSAFEHYDDGVEHSIWLSLMRDRLEIIRKLLSNDGSLWITIDDNEAHYLKVLCDEVFGRVNFVANVVWQKKYNIANDAIWLSDSHDHILVYAKNKQIWRPNKLDRTENSNKSYKNPDNDPRGPWMSDNYTCNKSADERPNLFYGVRNPNTGEEIWPKRTAVWRYNQDTHKKNISENLIYWGVNGQNSTLRLKRFLNSLRSDGRVCDTIWIYSEVGHTQDAKKEQLVFNSNDPFSTPKPEKLLNRILHIATNPNDLVLDSFAGSGTTGALAHKMGRRWIMIELGEHCHTHIIPRIKKVIDGEDQGGITEAVNWKGGGGFRYYKSCHSYYKFDSKTEKDLAIILESDKHSVVKWLRPAQNQFRIYWHHNEKQYHPDFVVETKDVIYLIETKKEGDLDSKEVQEKARAALWYCKHATDFTTKHGGKPWIYILIPHSKVQFNMGFEHLMKQYEFTGL